MHAMRTRGREMARDRATASKLERARKLMGNVVAGRERGPPDTARGKIETVSRRAERKASIPGSTHHSPWKEASFVSRI
jgi:hypothetical protein